VQSFYMPQALRSTKVDRSEGSSVAKMTLTIASTFVLTFHQA